jgi:4-hydroxybenzoate polyprenyltransferase
MRLKNKETPFYSTLVNFVGSQSIFIINLLTGILVARALGPENKGVYVASVLVITVYSPIFVFGYNGGVLYNFVTKRLNISSFFYVALTALFVISLFSGLSVMLLAQQG